MGSREVVHSRQNPAFKRLAERKRRARGGTDALLVEGPRLLDEALAAGVVLLEAAVSERAAALPGGPARLRRLRDAGVPVRVFDEPLLASLSELETSQGVLALARPPALDEARIFQGNPLVLVAVGVQNPGNLGGLLRTAEAAGASGAWLSGGCADPFGWKSLRGSAGSAFRLPLRRQVEPATLLEELHARGVRCLAAVGGEGVRHDEVDMRGPLALLLGNEGSGLPAPLSRAADGRVSIRLAGRVESLNVGVAAGVLLFEAARQRRDHAPQAC